MAASDEPRAWRVAIYVSIGLWFAMVAGNVALYAVRPTGHWPALETIEALQAASLVPVALLLYRLYGPTAAMLVITALGLVAITAGILISLGFAAGLVTFGIGPVGGPVYLGGWVLLLAWLLAANVVALRNARVPRSVALLGIGTALTATLLYPWWAIRLSRLLDQQFQQNEHPAP
jgi:hypothetical protein